MTKLTLTQPIMVDGKEVSAITIRRPKGRDLIAVGDHLAAFGRFQARNSAAVKDARAGGKEVITIDDINPSLLALPDAEVYRAMVAIVGQLADIGAAAEELDQVDLTEAATISILGELPRPGETGMTGGTP